MKAFPNSVISEELNLKLIDDITVMKRINFQMYIIDNIANEYIPHRYICRTRHQSS
jgi:hypothetical protein